MTRILFGILYTQGAWVAGGSHQTFIDISAFAPPWHQGLYPKAE
jgi:hypothetical protein